MLKTIKNKFLISILAMNTVNLFVSADVFAIDVFVNNNVVKWNDEEATLPETNDFQGQTYTGTTIGNNINVSNSTLNSFSGAHFDINGSRTISNYSITLQNSEVKSNVIGINYAGYGSIINSINDISVKIIDTNVGGNIIGTNITQYARFYNTNYNFTVSLEGSDELRTSVNGDVIALQRNTMRNFYNFNASNSYISVKNNVNISNSNLYAYKDNDSSNNTQMRFSGDAILTLDDWSGDVKGVYNFNDINFNNINWVNSGTVLNITANTKQNALANTNININSLNFAGGTELTVGESMYIINGKDLGIGTGKGKVDALSNFTAGVTIAGTGTAEVASDGNSVKYTLTKVKHTDQIDLVAENRAVAAAFVNQGTDLISDSLDTISRDSNYGVKTFAAVHGNRSKYDVNSDIKINGWSTIVGVGNADKFDNGSEFSWGVFYENGSGNYRTFNEFNNEFFRGDGSLVYNGGGIAARYTNKNGVYTEGSLRAGMLKSDMDNALRDGAGNFYGYESESAYYGAHIGIGKTISLSESSDLDIYGKFFHTYTEGDSFKVANDEFEFDSINSDRLRIGARITSNKENKFSTYYGLAYEYEFNGNADMTAQGLKAPTQSSQGSSVMAEVGFNYQPTPTSPWSFDLNMRGYAGERQGGSFNVQATYTF